MASEIKVDTISEKTSANGVSIDSVVHKDSAVYPSSADGGALGSASNEWSDLFLADSSVIKFGADQDTTLTHTDGTGLTLNSTNKLCFNDASQFVQGSSATVLSIGATDEIDLTATAIDINGTCDISGTFSLGGTNITTTAAEINLIDGGTSRGTTALADGDGILINDAGTMRMTNVTAVKTYMATAALAGIDDQTSSNDDQLTITDTAVVINEDSDDLDFRIESNSNANFLHIDGANDTMIIGSATTTDLDSYDTVFAIEGGGNFTRPVLRISSNATNKDCEIHLVNPSSSGASSGASIAFYEGTTRQTYMHHSFNGGTFAVLSSAGTVWSINEGTTVCDGDFNDTSDRGLKENIQDIASGVDIIKQLEPKTFTWKNEKVDRGDSAGFIAQELKEILPDLVSGTEYDGSLPEIERKKLSIKVQGIVAYLTKAVQELDSRVKTLEG